MLAPCNGALMYKSEDVGHIFQESCIVSITFSTQGTCEANYPVKLVMDHDMHCYETSSDLGTIQQRVESSLWSN